MKDFELIQAARDMAQGGCAECHRSICPVDRDAPKGTDCEEYLLESLANRLTELIPHKIIIAGSRSFSDYSTFNMVCKDIFSQIKGFPIIISGDATGADQLGVKFAAENKIPVIHMPADWKLYGKRAGMIRNRKMLEIADRLIAFWDGASPGTANMIQIAKEKGIPVHVVERSVLE